MPKATILVGDVRARLKDIESDSVQTCITSPPYWGLRDYGTASWSGGDINCDHAYPDEHKNNTKMTVGQKTSHAGRFAGDCRKCGATRIDSQIGLEQTPEAYVEQMVNVFREVRRVLKDDGTLWLNLGDSYNSTPAGKSVGGFQGAYMKKNDKYNMAQTRKKIKGKKIKDLKPKDLIGIPWRVAFALQTDGWYLRQDIIWHKPNPMPESVRDRCTKAHEYVFLLSKSAKYHYNNKAILEPVKDISLARAEYGWDSDRPSTKNASMGGQGIHVKKMGTRFVNPEGRNKRSVWTITTKAFREAHFAVMPEALVEPCVRAGSSEGDIVLDPFMGAATTGVVALRHNRDFVGVELNPEYVEIAKNRIEEQGMMFTDLDVVA